MLTEKHTMEVRVCGREVNPSGFQTETLPESRTSMSGWRALNPSIRGTSHLPANDGATLTVSIPPPIVGGADRRGGPGQHIETLRQQRKASLSGVGEPDRAVEPAKQRHAEPILKLADLMADRCRRHGEFACGAGKAQVPGRRLKGSERVEGRKPAHHTSHTFKFF